MTPLGVFIAQKFNSVLSRHRSNLENRTKVLRSDILLSAAYIRGLVNIVSYGDISNAGKLHTEEPKAISAFYVDKDKTKLVILYVYTLTYTTYIYYIINIYM